MPLHLIGQREIGLDFDIEYPVSQEFLNRFLVPFLYAPPDGVAVGFTEGRDDPRSREVHGSIDARGPMEREPSVHAIDRARVKRFAIEPLSVYQFCVRELLGLSTNDARKSENCKDREQSSERHFLHCVLDLLRTMCPRLSAR